MGGQPNLSGTSWITDASAVLLTDLDELTMLRAYFEAMDREAVFDLFVRRLPETRNFLVACGLDQALTFLGAPALLARGAGRARRARHRARGSRRRLRREAERVREHVMIERTRVGG